MEYTVPPACDGKKLVNFLRGYLGMSARSVTKLRHDPGSLLCNGAPIRTVDPVYTGDRLTVCIHEPEGAILPEGQTPEVVYEDDDLLVLNKPAGLAVHPTHNHQGDTLANAVAGYLAGKGKSGAFRAVGRLDKQTSGLVLCALHRHCATLLAGNYTKTYLAVAEGSFSGSGEIDFPIIRPDPMKTLRAVGEGGDPALTRWTAVCSDGHRQDAPDPRPLCRRGRAACGGYHVRRARRPDRQSRAALRNAGVCPSHQRGTAVSHRTAAPGFSEADRYD